jgi:hypothetical protein
MQEDTSHCEKRHKNIETVGIQIQVTQSMMLMDDNSLYYRILRELNKTERGTIQLILYLWMNRLDIAKMYGQQNKKRNHVYPTTAEELTDAITYNKSKKV